MKADATTMTQSSALLGETPPAAATPPLAGLGAGTLVLGVLAVAALVLTRWRARAPRRLQLLEALPLGGRRGVCLVRVEERLLVLGTSEAGVHLVTSLDAPVSGPSRPPSDFALNLLEASDELGLRGHMAAASPPERAR